MSRIEYLLPEGYIINGVYVDSEVKYGTFKSKTYYLEAVYFTITRKYVKLYDSNRKLIMKIKALNEAGFLLAVEIMNKYKGINILKTKNND